MQRCKEAESKVLQIMEWVNAALLDDPASPTRPVVIVTDDFAPSLGPSAKETITKMSRAQLSHMDLASFSDRFGTLTLGGGARRGLGNGNGHKMLREESRFDLAGGMGDDEVF